jgi:hypothetical protein
MKTKVNQSVLLLNNGCDRITGWTDNYYFISPGTGDGSNCDAFTSQTSKGLNINPNTSSPGNWSAVDNQAIGTPRDATQSKNMSGSACIGSYN